MTRYPPPRADGTAAPLIVGDKIFTGVAGGEYGILREPGWRDRIGDYDDFLRQGYRAHFYFITTGTDVDAKCKKIARQKSARQEDVSFFALDFSSLKELYVEAQRLEKGKWRSLRSKFDAYMDITEME